MGAHSILTVADAARILRVSVDVVYRLLATRARHRLDREHLSDHATETPPGAAGVG